jgi:hypothetical protein
MADDTRCKHDRTPQTCEHCAYDAAAAADRAVGPRFNRPFADPALADDADAKADSSSKRR